MSCIKKCKCLETYFNKAHVRNSIIAKTVVSDSIIVIFLYARTGDPKAGATPRACDREASVNTQQQCWEGQHADQEIPTVARRAEWTHPNS